MYVPIFVEKDFNSADTIVYLTSPLDVGGFKSYIYDLQLRELAKGAIVTLEIEESGTGDYNHDDEWSLLGSPVSINSKGHKVGQVIEFAQWIRFRIIIENSRGKASAKISLTGHLTRRA